MGPRRPHEASAGRCRRAYRVVPARTASSFRQGGQRKRRIRWKGGRQTKIGNEPRYSGDAGGIHEECAKGRGRPLVEMLRGELGSASCPDSCHTKVVWHKVRWE